jgi:hypothetical protein
MLINTNWDMGYTVGGAPREDWLLPYKWLFPHLTDPDLKRFQPFDVPCADCCVCRLHGSDWMGEIDEVTGGLIIYNNALSELTPKLSYNNTAPNGSGLPPDFFLLEAPDAGGWDGSKRIVWHQGRALGEMNTYTNYFVVGRDQQWWDVLRSGDVTSDANRLRWQKHLTQTLYLNASTPFNPRHTAAVAFGNWTGSHHGGRVNMGVVGTGHFELGRAGVGAWSITNGQTRAMNATVDGATALYISSFAPGNVQLQRAYTNAVAPNVEFRSVLNVHSIGLEIKPDMNTNGVVNAVAAQLLAQNRAANSPLDVLYYATNNIYNLIHFELANAPTNGQQHVIFLEGLTQFHVKGVTKSVVFTARTPYTSVS